MSETMSAVELVSAAFSTTPQEEQAMTTHDDTAGNASADSDAPDAAETTSQLVTDTPGAASATTPPVSTPTSPEDSTERGRRSGVASDGRQVQASDYTLSENPISYPPRFAGDAYVPETDVDYTDLSSLNRQINRARQGLFRANRGLTIAQRDESKAKFDYKRAHSRVLVGLSGGSERQRLAIADLEVEEQYAEWVIKEKIVEEMVNQVRVMRTELDALTVLSHNLRAQINLA